MPGVRVVRRALAGGERPTLPSPGRLYDSLRSSYNRSISHVELATSAAQVSEGVWNSDVIEVGATEFMTPFEFIFLYEKHLFLTFSNRTVAVWNLGGELVASFEDLMISYCKAKDVCHDEGEGILVACFNYFYASFLAQALPSVGSINVGDILTGKCIAKICPPDPHLQIGRRKQGDTSGSTIKEALESVTALFYDEHRNEIYTGNKQGLVHVWSKPLIIGDNLQACL
ncbi:hypothetical protein BHM03_00054092 [Ensete ventricosum]|nr:hypothetical protein BHM03_00054092 [Ensete ventricosum]